MNIDFTYVFQIILDLSIAAIPAEPCYRNRTYSKHIDKEPLLLTMYQAK